MKVWLYAGVIRLLWRCGFTRGWLGYYEGVALRGAGWLGYYEGVALRGAGWLGYYEGVALRGGD